MFKFIVTRSSVSLFRQSNRTRLRVAVCIVCALSAVAVEDFSVGSKAESFVASASPSVQ